MAPLPTIFIVCSDRSRNGKTLLARVIVDHLLIEERDPFCFDLNAPDAALRAFFPGRTALLDFGREEGRAKLFDTILARGGRDYVIDVGSAHLAQFCDAVSARHFARTARDNNFRLCVLYIIDRDEKSLKTAVEVEEVLLPDLFVPVVNHHIGSALPDGVPGPTLAMAAIDADLHVIVSSRRFSLRGFMLGDETGVPARLRANLKSFMQGIIASLRELGPTPGLQGLRQAGS